jgi:anti-anti-sigma regulatory factor
MLRIGVHDESDSTTFTVEGTLTAPFAAELEKCWRGAVAVTPSKAIVVNLASVTFVDSASRELLACMRRQGVQLVPTGCLMKAIVELIEAELGGDTVNKNPSEIVTGDLSCDRR